MKNLSLALGLSFVLLSPVAYGASGGVSEKSAQKIEESQKQVEKSVREEGKAIDEEHAEHHESFSETIADSAIADYPVIRWFLNGDSQTSKVLLESSVFGLKLIDLLASLSIVILTLIFKNVIVQSFFRRLKVFSERKSKKFQRALLESVEKPASVFVLLFGLLVAIQVLPITTATGVLSVKIFQGASMVVMAWGLLRFSDVFLDHVAKKRNEESILYNFLPLIKKSVKIFIIVVGFVMVIDNLGYNVGSILAALGVGGAALAFASRDTVANFFGSLCIVLDRPFKVGDWIEVDGKLNGDVVSIGLRSTRIKTFMATILSIPNSVLANETINNWSQMPKRRVKQTIGVTYETSPEVMPLIVEDIRKLLREDEDVNQDFILVNFTDFGQSSLDILVYYFTNTTNWLEYLDVRQKINTKIMKAIKDRGSSIAYPTRMLYFGDKSMPRGMDTGLPSDGSPEGSEDIPKGL